MGGGIDGGADQSLRLDEEGTYSLHSYGDGGAAELEVALRHQVLRRVLHRAQSRLAHLVDAELSRTAEAVLLSTEDTVHIVFVSIELQDDIHCMLKDLRTSDAALLVDVPDE